ncbi:MAG: DUF6273 domain-containing protein [Erysipelotrichaceae bacterium]|nr:DUF6273 domain-containing protein [Erysipelotrichaceae bacterium]
MVENETYQLIEKISTKNSYLSKAKVELKNRDFGLAEKDYIKVLELDENNVEAHFGLLMCQNKCSDLSALSEYYLHLYESNVPNSIKACDIDQKLIEDAAEKFYLPDYLEKQDITDRFKYEGAFYYDSYYNARYEDNQNIRKEFDNDDLLKWIRSSADKTATSFVWNIKDEYERRITKASEDDKYNATLVSTAYQRFMLRTYNELRIEHKHLTEQREKDYIAYGKIADESDSIEELENTITKLTHFTDKPDHTLYIDRCYRRIDVIKEKQKQAEKEERINDLIKEGYDHLNARRIEQADESFIKALALDTDNLEAHFGLLVCDKGLKNKEELIEFYKNLYFKDVKEIIIACERNDVHINELAEKNEVEGYLSKEDVFNLYDYSAYSFDSVLKSRLEARSLIEDEFKVDKTLSYIVKRDDPECKEFYKEIISAYEDRIDEAKAEDDQNYTTLNTDYQRFLYRAYSSLNALHEEALDRRRRDFNDAVSLFNSTKDINELKRLISRFADFKGYDRADQYIGYCQRKIQELSESESRRRFDEQIDMLLTMGDDFLSEGLFDSAEDEYKEVLSLDYQNERALLGTLLVDSRARNIEELEERYVNLYKEDRSEQKKIDVDQEMIDRKVKDFVGEEISEEFIRDLYFYNDLYYDSLTDIRINEKKLLVDDFKLNNILNRLMDLGNAEIKTFYNDVISVYDKRISDSIEADEKKKDELLSKYATFVKNKDEILERKKREVFERHAEEIEAFYQENINVFAKKDLSKEELEALIKRFEIYPEYKDSAIYIEQCKNRISKIELDAKNAMIDSLVSQGEDAINNDDFAQAAIIFDRIMKIEESPVAHEGSLLSRYRITSYDELKDYYINKYSDHEPEVLQAFFPDEKHILKAIDKFSIKDLMDEKYIRSFYEYDLTYESYLKDRMRQEKALNRDLEQDYDITYLLANDDNELKETIKELRMYFKKRIAEAKKADELSLKVLKRNYAIFLRNKDRELRDIYTEFVETGNAPDIDEFSDVYTDVDDIFDNEKEKKIETVIKDPSFGINPVEAVSKEEPEEKPVAEKPKSKAPAKSTLNNKHVSVEKKEPVKPPVVKAKKEPKDRFIYIVAVFVLAFLGVLGYFAYDRLIVPANTYKQAEALVEAGQYDEAIEMFKSLKNYRDAAEKVGETDLLKADALYADGKIADALNIMKNYEEQNDKVNTIKEDIIKKANIGDTIIFGEYEQDGLSSDGREFIEWIVLDKADNNLFVISKNALEMQKFSLTEDSSYWEISFVRSFLNRRFPDNAFNNENPTRVMDTTVSNYRIATDDDPYDEIVSVDWNVQDMMPYETVDKLFLLSIEEVDQYLKQSDRFAKASPYLIGQGTSITSEGNCDWWLRSPGNEDISSAYIKGSDGQVSSSMNPISNCVRPAMWLKIS